MALSVQAFLVSLFFFRLMFFCFFFCFFSLIFVNNFAVQLARRRQNDGSREEEEKEDGDDDGEESFREDWNRKRTKGCEKVFGEKRTSFGTRIAKKERKEEKLIITVVADTFFFFLLRSCSSCSRHSFAWCSFTNGDRLTCQPTHRLDCFCFTCKNRRRRLRRCKVNLVQNNGGQSTIRRPKLDARAQKLLITHTHTYTH